MFYVGQKVVCVDVSPNSIGYIPAELKLNTVYTIAGFGEPDIEGDLGIYLIEVLSVPSDDLADDFKSWRFRPLVDIKQEVSFTVGASPDSEQWDNRKVKVK